jgi:hypothetical protein
MVRQIFPHYIALPIRGYDGDERDMSAVGLYDKTPPTLEALINQYRQWISTKRIYTKTLGSFAAQDGTKHATLAITEAKSRSNNRSKCVCGLTHNSLRCYTLNLTAEGRPENYQPNRIALSTICTAFKNQELLKKIKKLYWDNNI